MSDATALIVDDEADILELVGITCTRMGVATRGAGTLADARRLLAQEPFDLCLTDMRLPDGNGTELVRTIAERFPSMPVAVITAYGNMESAVAAMKAGAFDFVSKPLELQVLRNLIGAALRLRARPESPSESPSESSSESPPALPSTLPGDRAEGRAADLLGTSCCMQEIRALIGKLARNQAPVFISGERGTGKELVARLIHARGPRADYAFVPVNCGAIPAEAMECELFGHVRGGGAGDRQGLFQAAHRGTLFLDEIAELALPMQVKLLRAIQHRSLRPVGAERDVAVDVRIISASDRDLGAAVDSGAFRPDLYYRINVIDLHMPPLRERPEDIDVLAGHILERIAAASDSAPKRLSADASESLARYPFAGNVRELENILERAAALCDDELLRSRDLRLVGAEAASASRFAAADALVPERGCAGAAGADRSRADQPFAARPLGAQLDEIEKQAILGALESTRWNRTAAAKLLGMTPRSLRYRLGKLGLG